MCRVGVEGGIAHESVQIDDAAGVLRVTGGRFPIQIRIDFRAGVKIDQGGVTEQCQKVRS